MSVRPSTASARGREASDVIASWRKERPFRRATRPPGEVANSTPPAPIRAGRRAAGTAESGRIGWLVVVRVVWVGVDVDDDVTVERPDELPPPVRVTAAAIPAPLSTIRPAPITSSRRERPGNFGAGLACRAGHSKLSACGASCGAIVGSGSDASNASTAGGASGGGVAGGGVTCATGAAGIGSGAAGGGGVGVGVAGGGGGSGGGAFTGSGVAIFGIDGSGVGVGE